MNRKITARTILATPRVPRWARMSNEDLWALATRLQSLVDAGFVLGNVGMLDEVNAELDRRQA